MTARLLLAGLCLAAAASAQPADSLRAEPARGATESVAPTQTTVVVDAAEGVVIVTVDGEAPRPPVRPGVATAVPAGRPVEVALVDAAAAWNPRRAVARVGPLAEGATARVALALPVRTRIETMPLGATLVLETDGAARPLGLAPVTVDLPPGATGAVVARLDGYADARAALGGAGGTVTLALAPVGEAAGTAPVVLLPTERSRLPRTLTDVGIGALALAAGAVAVYYKFEADAVDDRYRDPDSVDRGSEVLRAEAARLDRTSAIALGAMQVGVVVLGLRFVLR